MNVNQFTINPNTIQTDSAGVIKSSNATTLGFYTNIEYHPSILYTEVSSNANATWANSVYSLNITGVNGYYIMQTKKFHPYFGYPQSIEMTTINMAVQTGLVKRQGYFSSSTTAPYNTALDGFFIEADGIGGNGLRLCIYNNGTLMQAIPFSSFQRADLISGYDYNNFTIFNIDFLWLGGRGIRVFQVINGLQVLIHSYVHAGTSTSLMMRSPHQPYRAEIRSNASTSSGTMSVVCAKVSTSGALVDIDNQFKGYDVKEAALTLASTGTKYVISAVRKQAGFSDIYATVNSMSLLTTSNTNVQFELLLNPTIAGTLTWTTVTGTGIEKARGVAANTVTAGTGLLLNSSTLTQNVPFTNSKKNLLSELHQTIAGVNDIIALCGIGGANNANVTTTLEIKEL